MQFREYAAYDGLGLAELVARGEVSPSELLDVALERAQAVNPTINAIVQDLEREARDSIASLPPDGIFRGTPFLLKDSNAQLKGAPTTYGSRAFNRSAEADSALVSAYRRSGLVIFGKTNTPELELNVATEPVRFGATANPWRLDRSPAGSSGGSAAAVAVGIVPAAHGSDGGGSIRIPAACCGLFGLKPSRGRVSMSPAGVAWGGLAIEHALTRSVRDSAALLDVAGQPQPGDPHWLPSPSTSFLDQIENDVGRLRIAYTTDALMTGALHSACRAAVEDAARLCEALGHMVEEARPTAHFDSLGAALPHIVNAAVAALLDREAELRGRPIERGELEESVWVTYQHGRDMRAVDRERAAEEIVTFNRTLARFFDQYDLLLLATTGSPPLPLGAVDADSPDLAAFGAKLIQFACNTPPFNASGQPAMSVPLYWTQDGLPVGVQFAARAGEDGLLLRLARQLEQARPWAHRRPALA